jgi:UDP-4-amino-4,6-dideoxy-N-acetyl-beta-L-altrosamine N-acetyltransferase
MIKGKIVNLRLVEKSDIEMIRKWRNSPEVNQYFSNKDQISQYQQEQWFDKISKDNTYFCFVVEFENEPAGIAEIKNIDLRNRIAEFGIYVAPQKLRNSLIPVETGYLILSYCFDYLNLRKIVGQILSTNPRSVRYSEGLGFVHEATFKNHVYHNGQYVDLLWFSLYEDNFSKVRERFSKMFAA